MISHFGIQLDIPFTIVIREYCIFAALLNLGNSHNLPNLNEITVCQESKMIITIHLWKQKKTHNITRKLNVWFLPYPQNIIMQYERYDQFCNCKRMFDDQINILTEYY